MRRLFFNLLISLLTFTVGLATSALQSVFAPSGRNTSSAYTTATLQPSQPATSQPTAASCRCSQKASANETSYIAEGASMPRAPISGGVLNGKAIRLPSPAYPPVAKAARADGTVVVQITIDEQGCVMAARAVSGHPLLQAAAVQAASQACFSPTRLSGQPVKVTGVITYNFVLP
jgi:TonB family protein